MTTIASQITSLTSVYSTVYSDAHQRKHQSSASLAFVWGSHRDRWIPRTKGQLRGKCFHLMTSSWCAIWYLNIFIDHCTMFLQWCRTLYLSMLHSLPHISSWYHGNAVLYSNICILLTVLHISVVSNAWIMFISHRICTGVFVLLLFCLFVCLFVCFVLWLYYLCSGLMCFIYIHLNMYSLHYSVTDMR